MQSTKKKSSVSCDLDCFLDFCRLNTFTRFSHLRLDSQLPLLSHITSCWWLSGGDSSYILAFINSDQSKLDISIISSWFCYQVFGKMPLFGKKQPKQRAPNADLDNPAEPDNNMSNPTSNPANGGPPPDAQPKPRPKLVFHCQQAHGSPTGMISGFTNVKELYQKIAECYDIQASQVRTT